MTSEVRKLKPFCDMSKEYEHVERIFRLYAYTYCIIAWQLGFPMIWSYDRVYMRYLLPKSIVLTKIVFAYLAFKDLQKYCDVLRKPGCEVKPRCGDSFLLKTIPSAPGSHEREQTEAYLVSYEDDDEELYEDYTTNDRFSITTGSSYHEKTNTLGDSKRT